MAVEGSRWWGLGAQTWVSLKFLWESLRRVRGGGMRGSALQASGSTFPIFALDFQVY